MEGRAGYSITPSLLRQRLKIPLFSIVQGYAGLIFTKFHSILSLGVSRERGHLTLLPPSINELRAH